MKVKDDNIIIFIDDNDERAIKIKEGYDFVIQNGTIIFTGGKTGLDLIDLEQKFSQNKASSKEIQDYLAYLIKNINIIQL